MDTGSFRYVDNIESNFLFRGGEPKAADGTFDHQGLAAAIQTAQIPPSVTRPQSFYFDPPGYYLIVLNLLHMNEVSELDLGLNYFKGNPTRGRIHLWDTDGTPDCYYKTAPTERDRLARALDQWLPDPLTWRTAMIRKWLAPQQVPMPVVIYVHCDGGCDRTGELIGAYRLRYMHDPWSAVIGDQPCGRPMGCDNYRALQWYAHWLNTTLGFSITGIGDDGGCTDPGGTHRPCTPADADR